MQIVIKKKRTETGMVSVRFLLRFSFSYLESLNPSWRSFTLAIAA